MQHGKCADEHPFPPVFALHPHRGLVGIVVAENLGSLLRPARRWRRARSSAPSLQLIAVEMPCCASASGTRPTPGWSPFMLALRLARGKRLHICGGGHRERSLEARNRLRQFCCCHDSNMPHHFARMMRRPLSISNGPLPCRARSPSSCGAAITRYDRAPAHPDWVEVRKVSPPRQGRTRAAPGNERRTSHRR